MLSRGLSTISAACLAGPGANPADKCVRRGGFALPCGVTQTHRAEPRIVQIRKKNLYHLTLTYATVSGESSIFSGIPTAKLARASVAKVTLVSSSSSNRFTTARLVPIRTAISVFVMCILFMASTNCQAITRLMAAAVTSSWMSSSFRKSSKSLPIRGFLRNTSYKWLLRALAVSKSDWGVFRDFLMKAWSNTILPPTTVTSTLAIRPSRWLRISHKSFPILRTSGMPSGQLHRENRLIHDHTVSKKIHSCKPNDLGVI